MKDELVEKLFRGTCTEEELQLLFQLIESDPNPPSPELMKRLWEASRRYPKLKEIPFERIFAKTLSRIDRGQGPKLWFSRPFVRIAAGFLLLGTACIWFWMAQPDSTTVQTAFGMQQSFELSDGSKIDLNANSEVSFSNRWEAGRDREIWLDGEAFFVVEKKPETDQKMKVITDDLVVEVLGTTFNVNSKGGKTVVYLEEGSIRLHLKTIDSVLVMEPGDLVVYSEQSGEIFTKRREMAELHTSWKDGVLTFEDASLREVIHKIEEIYGVNFKVVEPLNYDRKVNFPLPIQELDMAISILDKTMTSITIQKEADHYLIE